MKRPRVCGCLFVVTSALFIFSTFVGSADAGSNMVTVCDEAHLRQAIALGGTIRFCCSGTITVSNTIDVTNNVALDASDYDVIISGGNTVRIFRVRTNSTLVLTHLWLADGRHEGTNGVNVGQPGEQGAGGAIYNEGGTVRLVSCILSNNSAVGGRGGPCNFSDFIAGEGGSGRGGAVFNRAGTIYFDSVVALSNSVAGGIGGSDACRNTNGVSLGGVLSSVGGSIFITNSLFVGNNARGRDYPYRVKAPAYGGVLTIEDALLTVANSSFLANRVFGEDLPTLAPNFGPPSWPYGGSVSIQSGTAFVNRCQFSINSAQGGYGGHGSASGAQGGAIHNLGTLWLRETSISSNQALAGNADGVRNANGQGGGLYNGGIVYLNGSTFDRNLARGGTGTSSLGSPGSDGKGGAIFNAGTLSGTNCTLALNKAVAGETRPPFGTTNLITGKAYGGAIHNVGVAVMMNVTIASNSVVEGLGANIANTNGSFSLRNSLVAYGIGFSNAWGTIADGGFNMSSDDSCSFNSGSSFNSTDPKLGPLADYGGPTLTMALQSDSPAIDFGTTAGAPPTDQRGFQRPFGTGVDMGAYEVGPPTQSLSWQRNGSTLEVLFTADAGVSYQLLRSTDLVSWQLEELIPASTTNQVVSRFIMMSETRQFFRLRAE